MDNMRRQAERFGAEFRRGYVTAVDLSQRPFKITVDETDVIEAEALIVATGASAKHLGIPGEDANIGRGVSYCRPVSEENATTRVSAPSSSRMFVEIRGQR